MGGVDIECSMKTLYHLFSDNDTIEQDKDSVRLQMVRR
jgi:hypothetical protein